MSLADCITLALKNNFTLIQEKNTLEVRYRRLQEKNLGRLPVFNFLSSNSYTIRETLPSPVYEAGINMKQPVYDRGTIGYDQEEALINYQKQILRYETRQNNVIYTADTYYYNLIGQDKLLIISQTSLEDSKKLLDISQARFKAGDIAEIEVLKAQVQVAQSEDDILTRQARRDTARDSLVRYLELDFGAEIIPTENIEYVSFNFNLEDCLNIAFNRRPEIKSTLLDVELAQIIYNREKSTILPEVALTGNLKYRGQHGITPATTYQFYISGIWEFPLYDRGKRSNTLRDYEANIEIAKINYEEVQKDIILEVRNSFR
ncbi:MAG TPA: TolC family protein, partial [Candidatus Eremiobacteraeota bacterium]|nr:TolC family protein [Candidatus Eremiobacteraeota bacterium]